MLQTYIKAGLNSVIGRIQDEVMEHLIERNLYAVALDSKTESLFLITVSVNKNADVLRNTKWSNIMIVGPFCNALYGI